MFIRSFNFVTHPSVLYSSTILFNIYVNLGKFVATLLGGTFGTVITWVIISDIRG